MQCLQGRHAPQSALEHDCAPNSATKVQRQAAGRMVAVGRDDLAGGRSFPQSRPAPHPAGRHRFIGNRAHRPSETQSPLGRCTRTDVNRGRAKTDARVDAGMGKDTDKENIPAPWASIKGNVVFRRDSANDTGIALRMPLAPRARSDRAWRPTARARQTDRDPAPDIT